MNSRILLSMAAGLGLLVSAHGSTLVIGYSGTGNVSTNQALGGAGTGFESGTAITPAAGYTGPVFYGAVASSDAAAAPITTWGIFNDLFFGNIPLTSDFIGVTNGATAIGADKHHYGFIHFKQPDFAEYSDLAGGVALNDTTPLSFLTRRTGGNPTDVAFVVETGAGYFMSEKITLTNNQANGIELVELVDPTSTDWFSFDPEASISVVGGAGAPDLGNVLGIGIWFDNVRAGSSEAGMGFYLTNIELTAIPEPSTYAALFGLLAIAVVAWRRRARA